MKELLVDLPQRPYPLFIERGLMDKVPSLLQKEYGGKKIAIITDNNVRRIYGEKFIQGLKAKGLLAHWISLEPGEESKTLGTLERIYEQLLDLRMTREDLIIAFGGGVVGDIAGFAAATYLRGIPFIQIPTSLLAQIDSSIGGKVAINLPRGKNLVGNFYQPQGVFIDPELLVTLEKRYLYDGMAEVIKYGCIRDKTLLDTLESLSTEEGLFHQMEEMIYKCCLIKKTVVERDERDRGERMLLNFGHTLGHAIEKSMCYQGISHGQAVAIGMYVMTKKSEEKGFTQRGTSEQIRKLLKKYHLPYEMPPIHREDIIGAVGVDKKSKGEYLHIIVLEKLGKAVIKKIAMEDIFHYI